MYKPNTHPGPWTRVELLFLFAAAFLVFASRLPWLAAGPGADPDSYRVINAAQGLAETGVYSRSRPPGFPVHEYLAAAVVHRGPFWTNLISTLSSVAAFVFLALILRRAGVRPYLWGALGFAFTPVIYISSSTTMDYMPALAFLLAATHLALARRTLAAGLCLGLAVGCRITSAAMLAPLALWMLLTTPRGLAVRQVLTLAAVTVVIAGLCFIPVFRAYGAGFFTFTDNHVYPAPMMLLRRGAIQVWGPLGVLALAALGVVLALRVQSVRRRLAEPGILPLAALGAGATAVFAAGFLRLPHEAGYLAPAVPFVLLTLGLVAPRPGFLLLALALLPASFVAVGSAGLSLNGPIRQDHHQRVKRQAYTQRLIQRVDQLPPSAVVVAGSELARIRTALGLRNPALDRYVFLVASETECEQYAAEGRPIYYLPSKNKRNIQVYGVDLRKWNARPLPSLNKDSP